MAMADEEKMVRTQVYLPRYIYDRLKRGAGQEGVTMASQIREALAQYVAAREAEVPRPILSSDDPIWELIGTGESGITDGSVDHDKYIYVRNWEPPQEEQ